MYTIQIAKRQSNVNDLNDFTDNCKTRTLYLKILQFVICTPIVSTKNNNDSQSILCRATLNIS